MKAHTRPYALLEISVVCWTEADQSVLSDWLETHGTGLDILHAGFVEADDHDIEQLVEQGYMPDENGEWER